MTRYREALCESHREDPDRGFTLIELLVVIIIIGILAAIAIPVFLHQRQKAHDAAAKSDLRNLANFEEIYLDDYGTYTTGALIEADEPTVDVSASDTLSVVSFEGPIGYCLSAHAAGSPNTWYYDSSNGGLQPANSSCASEYSTSGGPPL